MHIVNVTDIRRNIRQILAEVMRTKKPAVIFQRSKPVAYLIDVETFEKMRAPEEADTLSRSRKESLERIFRLRAKVVGRTGVQGSSVSLIREFREGLGRYE